MRIKLLVIPKKKKTSMIEQEGGRKEEWKGKGNKTPSDFLAYALMVFCS